jgi:hypothetical protein
MQGVEFNAPVRGILRSTSLHDKNIMKTFFPRSPVAIKVLLTKSHSLGQFRRYLTAHRHRHVEHAMIGMESGTEVRSRNYA